MFNRKEAIGLIVGAQILGLIETLDKKERRRGATKKFIQWVRGNVRKQTKTDKNMAAEVAADSLKRLIEYDEQISPEDKKPIYMATLIQSISFSFENEVRAFFGDEYFIRLESFTNRQTELANSSILADYTYELADQLVDSIRKFLHDKKVQGE